MNQIICLEFPCNMSGSSIKFGSYRNPFCKYINIELSYEAVIFIYEHVEIQKMYYTSFEPIVITSFLGDRFKQRFVTNNV